MSTIQPDIEAFIEERPTAEGHNLRHFKTSPGHFGRHWTGAECPCKPEHVPHTTKETQS